MGRVEGKVAFITGAGRGQGRAHAIRLAEEGADIVALDVLEDVPGLPYPMASTADRDETVAAVEATGRRILFEKADVRDLARLSEVAELGRARFGHIDVVVANAGAGAPAVSYEMSEQTFSDTIDRFLTSTWRTVRAVAPGMIEAGRGGSIILISSTSGLVGVPGMAHYVAAKHGVTGLMKALAIDLGPFDIRVNAVATSNVNTPMIRNPAIRNAWAGRLTPPTTRSCARCRRCTSSMCRGSSRSTSATQSCGWPPRRLATSPDRRFQSTRARWLRSRSPTHAPSIICAPATRRRAGASLSRRPCRRCPSAAPSCPASPRACAAARRRARPVPATCTSPPRSAPSGTAAPVRRSRGRH